MTAQNWNFSDQDKGPPSPIPARPIEPGLPVEGPMSGPSRMEKGRAGLVLLFGVLSLFLCGPLGVIAFIMGAAELRKIRAGLISLKKKGEIMIGMGLGLVGILTSVVVFTYLWYALPTRLPQIGDLGPSGPLSADQVVFAGEWDGNRGTVIVIRIDGTGDFKARNSTVTGGRVKIEKDTLSIGLFGIYKTWRITRRPYYEDGKWRMDLDGETFTRKASGSLVLFPQLLPSHFFFVGATGGRPNASYPSQPPSSVHGYG
jgi:hypothetical protein